MTDQFATEIDLPASAEKVFRHLTEPRGWFGFDLSQKAVAPPSTARLAAVVQDDSSEAR